MGKRNRTVEEFKRNGGYLPEVLKDFHDQKDVFKSLHWNYENNPPKSFKMPDWAEGHVYVIDWFLWFMASYGYTLQRSRAKVDFKSTADMHTARKQEEFSALKSYMGKVDQPAPQEKEE